MINADHLYAVLSFLLLSADRFASAVPKLTFSFGCVRISERNRSVDLQWADKCVVDDGRDVQFEDHSCILSKWYLCKKDNKTIAFPLTLMDPLKMNRDRHRMSLLLPMRRSMGSVEFGVMDTSRMNHHLNANQLFYQLAEWLLT